MLRKLALGTAQLGLDYGVNNQLGQPTVVQAEEILDLAFANGIRSIDTAAAYGTAEQIVGNWLEKNSRREQLRLLSKLRPDVPLNSIRDELRQSLDRLNCQYLDGFLLHQADLIYDERYAAYLEDLKSEGLIRSWGVSVYSVKDALHAVKLAGIGCIQVPYSVFDQRLDRTNFFELAKEQRVTVFARSVFVQGLISMALEDVPPKLLEAKELLQRFDKIVGEFGIPRHHAALWFALTHDGINKVVFGVDSTKQLQQNIATAQAQLNFDACRDKIVSEFSEVVISPLDWS